MRQVWKKKKLLKNTLLLSFMLGSVWMLTGCHGSRQGLEPFTIPAAFDTSAQHEITFWAKNDTNKTQTTIYEQAIADFQELYPNIRVNLRLYTDYGKIYNDVITNIATGTTPNVCITYPDHIATYLTGFNLVVPLDDLFYHEKYGLGGSEVTFDAPAADEIIPQFLEECSIAGHYYAVPYMRSTEACYINKTYVEALGYRLPEVLTWDFVWEVAEAAMVKDAEENYIINGQKVMIPFIYKSTDNMMIQMLRQKNADYSTAEGEILLFHDTTEDLLRTIAEHVKSGAFSTFKVSSYPANFLNAGQCIFAVDSTAGATWMGTNAPLLDISADQLVEFETEVMMIPQFAPEHPQMISQGPSVCIFNKEDSQEVLASWLFVQYLLSDKVQIAYSKTEGYVPVTSKAQNTAEYQAYLSDCGRDNTEHYDVKIRAAELLLDNTGHTFVTPVFNGSASLRDAAGMLIEQTVKSVRRGQVIDEAYFDTLYSDITSRYRLDQLGESSASVISGKSDLGALPGTSVLLLAAIGGTWVLILLYVIARILKRKKEESTKKSS
ncbi:extracellular solute-binding protein [Acetatifactor muris]|uniref:Glycerol-3-phosphate transporter periplasmic binding protein n=1 Tax=Acetatifactor muris TaxID=879566 RepID=A0A2K4ZM41_9FIRM|nr:extracellular solute-binding protein [Acetatifactor muris]MCR2049768.1 extracellular solute-binding protein [Acetatifactor muris]SOY31557.1 glycerol-3-phosphate transporter periplasmic binding protein [Acetatifactor muris]